MVYRVEDSARGVLPHGEAHTLCLRVTGEESLCERLEVTSAYTPGEAHRS